FLFFNISPLNSAIMSVVHPRMRATAMAINILLIHLFGDAISTVVIGKISDITDSLTAGLLLGPIMILIGGVILLFGAKQLETDQLAMQKVLENQR
ncbi:MAG TPA: MFS transporter, partial [Acidobacteriota bacterium]|nr:MFS transporter [Acidobacteriota bacterium]